MPVICLWPRHCLTFRPLNRCWLFERSLPYSMCGQTACSPFYHMDIGCGRAVSRMVFNVQFRTLPCAPTRGLQYCVPHLPYSTTHGRRTRRRDCLLLHTCRCGRLPPTTHWQVTISPLLNTPTCRGTSPGELADLPSSPFAVPAAVRTTLPTPSADGCVHVDIRCYHGSPVWDLPDTYIPPTYNACLQPSIPRGITLPVRL